MLATCLASVAALQPQPAEVIVAVDGADGGVLSRVAGYGFRVVELPSKPGVSAARNAGASAAAGKVVLFVDSDVALPNDFVARTASAFAACPDAAAIMGSYDDSPAAPSLISRYRNLLHHYTHQHGARDANSFWAACGAIRRDVFLRIGGFDESYRLPSVEDIELGYRLRRSGFRIRLVPDWQVRHLKQWRLHDLFVTDFSCRAVPWTRLLHREGRIDNDLNLGWTSRVSAALVCLAILFLVAGIDWTPSLFLAAVTLLGAIVLNLRFYRLLAARGGFGFALLSIPLHWLYFAVAMAGFAAGTVGRGREQLQLRWAQ